MDTEQQAKRSTLVINPGVQYREALVSASVSVLSVNLIVIVGTLFPGSSGVRIAFSPMGYVGVAVVGVLLLGGAWYFSLRRSHALAGPVYAITREIAKLGEGDVAFRIDLRPGDGFQQEAILINAAAEQLREQIHQVKTLVAELEHATTMEEVDRLRSRLSGLLAALNTLPSPRKDDA
jgi:methyl-accepting chemotaxis protein